jgi:hypothetical protein
MLPDPISLTINAVATAFPRTKNGDGIAVYTTADGMMSVTTKQNVSKDRFRRELRISQRKFAVDPIGANNVNVEKSASFYLVVDEPKAGFSDTELGYIINALVTYFGNPNTASSPAARLLGGEI